MFFLRLSAFAEEKSKIRRFRLSNGKKSCEQRKLRRRKAKTSGAGREKRRQKGKIGTQSRHHLTKTSVFLPNNLTKERLSSNKPQMFHVKHLRLVIKVPQSRALFVRIVARSVLSGRKVTRSHISMRSNQSAPTKSDQNTSTRIAQNAPAKSSQITSARSVWDIRQRVIKTHRQRAVGAHRQRVIGCADK